MCVGVKDYQVLVCYARSYRPGRVTWPPWPDQVHSGSRGDQWAELLWDSLNWTVWFCVSFWSAARSVLWSKAGSAAEPSREEKVCFVSTRSTVLFLRADCESQFSLNVLAKKNEMKTVWENLYPKNNLSRIYAYAWVCKLATLQLLPSEVASRLVDCSYASLNIVH